MHPHMGLNIDECVEMTHLKEKITAIIPTRNSPIKSLMWSVFSLLLRSRPNSTLEHICVCINGPDERTGDTILEDKKQAFLEDLRNEEWFHSDSPNNVKQMPLTVIRAWSRVGYSESFEMALNWVHTDAYLLMHDDVLIMNPFWCEEVKKKFYDDDNVAIAYIHPLLGCPCDHAIHKGMYLLRLPQMQTTFVLCKKKWIMKAGAKWKGFHIPSDDNFLQFDLEEVGNTEEFENFWIDRNLYPEPVIKNELYNFVRQEVGAWVYYKLFKQGNSFVKLKDSNIIHLEGISNTNSDFGLKVISNFTQIRALEKEIKEHPVYSKIYEKYNEE